MDIKSFFHAWCNKLGKMPVFDVRAVGLKHRQRFLCEVKVEGYPYTGCGNSTNKKDAQFNAATDFVLYLVRQNIINASDVPKDAFLRDGTFFSIIKVPKLWDYSNSSYTKISFIQPLHMRSPIQPKPYGCEVYS